MRSHANVKCHTQLQKKDRKKERQKDRKTDRKIGSILISDDFSFLPVKRKKKIIFGHISEICILALSTSLSSGSLILKWFYIYLCILYEYLLNYNMIYFNVDFIHLHEY
jgi:hypothetical protein